MRDLLGIQQLGWTDRLPLIVDAHGERALEIPSRIGNLLRNLAPDNSVLRRVPHLKLAAGNLRGGDNFEIGNGHEIPDVQLTLAYNGQGRRLHAFVFTASIRYRPTPFGKG